ncbi:MAG: hypothetical protein AAB359_00205, partial [Elusimicrobiota bacterium]
MRIVETDLRPPASCPCAKRRGQMAIMLVIGTLLFLLITIPLLDRYVKNEAKWSVKEKKSTTAFHLAEAGIDRAVWKLNERSSYWDYASTGTVFAGYNNDKTYTDLPGGSYRVKISSGSAPRQIKIMSTGRDASSSDLRAIEALYEAESLNAAIQAPSLQFNSSFKVFWGPYMSLSNISLNSSADQLYPRKYARGSITSSSSYGDRDNSATPANTDCLEYWAYNDATCGSSGVPDMPGIAIDWYRAQSQIAPNEYYGDLNGTETFNSLQDNVPKIRFFESNASFTGTTHFRGWVIAIGKVTFNTSGYDNAAYGSYTVATASIPATAWKEHQKNVFDKGNTAGGCASACAGGGEGKANDGNYLDDVEAKADDCCVDQYPADAGYHTVSDFNFKTGRVGTNKLAGHSGEPVAFKGFI